MSVTYLDATQILAGAFEEAERQGVSVAVVVVDSAGRTLLGARMDSCSQLGLDAATGKAYTAASLGMPTSVWEERSQVDPAFAGTVSTVPGFTPLSGGEPILLQAEVVGAIGVSGATSAQDVAIAHAGLTAFASLS